MNVKADSTAVAKNTARQEYALASPTCVTSASPMPTGQPLRYSDMAKMSSLSLNQSASILVISTNCRTTPTPVMKRPATNIAYEVPRPLTTPPAAINASPPSTMRFSPKRRPR